MESLEDEFGPVPTTMWSDGTLDAEIEEALAVIGPLCEGTNEM